jgi:hypothetical protein
VCNVGAMDAAAAAHDVGAAVGDETRAAAVRDRAGSEWDVCAAVSKGGSKHAGDAGVVMRACDAEVAVCDGAAAVSADNGAACGAAAQVEAEFGDDRCEVEAGDEGQGEEMEQEDGGSVGDGAPPPAVWRRRRAHRQWGSQAAHARFLQYLFRRTRAVRPGCWCRGGMRGLRWWRPLTSFGCSRGLARAAAFRDQGRCAEDALCWYRMYVELHRSWHSGRTPTALVTFCGQGGVSEGVRRAGGAAHGQDAVVQPRYTARYGEESFSCGDSCNPTGLRGLQKAARTMVTLASPPCKQHSSARMRGEASEPALIGATRDALQATARCWAIENVTGASAEMAPHTTLLRGSMFGLHVDRPRLWEASFDLHVDEALLEGGRKLRQGCCLGFRRRWRRLDPWGRPEMHDCCAGCTHSF